jgi:hypothetical protein
MVLLIVVWNIFITNGFDSWQLWILSMFLRFCMTLILMSISLYLGFRSSYRNPLGPSYSISSVSTSINSVWVPISMPLIKGVGDLVLIDWSLFTSTMMFIVPLSLLESCLFYDVNIFVFLFFMRFVSVNDPDIWFLYRIVAILYFWISIFVMFLDISSGSWSMFMSRYPDSVFSF